MFLLLESATLPIKVEPGRDHTASDVCDDKEVLVKRIFDDGQGNLPNHKIPTRGLIRVLVVLIIALREVKVG